jgi:molecular chaperone GrpE
VSAESVPNGTGGDQLETQEGAGEAETTAGERLEAEIADLQDRLLRGQAEFQNFRRRVDKERMELSEYASMEAVRELLPILDDFERGLQVECVDGEYAKGMELIYQRLSEALKKLGHSHTLPGAW